ncbi:adenylosuccinate synthase [Tunicatimonas pelagia]|uniref:adenylosuccinate synthase n=1 Tax=Tunicatimonas pelagia TaxID=931531 RepID=UPI00266502E2|nr:adenylosuccinate synthase [Tunicatimonas pelagia]WKN43361.1 adenylosuccinate synthase [Tunicatimonas pelagia]
MSVDVLLGLQWGDEGKGKIVDYLAPKYNVIARFQGGPNAGHTLEFDQTKHVLHQIPSGVFRPEAKNVIGNGVVLDPVILQKEIVDLQNKGVDPTQNLYVSKKAQLILPTHRLLDAAYEQAKGDKKIGSTLKGIGPTYQDKIGRLGMRVGDVLRNDFAEFYRSRVDEHKKKLASYNYSYDLEPLEQAFWKAADFLKTLNLIDSEIYLHDQLDQQIPILAEGAQGALLDIDFGSYPFVTSSTTTAAGACTGLGIAPRHIGEVFGIFKAYCTRVGSGPFPTELHDSLGEELRKKGCEFGATTGRPRRCGWLDLPALNYAVKLNGVTQLFMMKADVLNGMDEIKVCTHYQLSDGSEIDYIPYDLREEEVKPIYQTMKGWSFDLNNASNIADLPASFHHYIEFIEDFVKVPINLVSLGPKRRQTLLKEDSLLATR